MEITIHNVGHGLCVSLVHENGNTMLWDCGHQENYRPSKFLPDMGIRRLSRLFISNYDEDHISDLPSLLATYRPGSLHRNKSINADQLRSLKRAGGPITPAMESMLGMINEYVYGPPDPPPQFPGVSYSVYSNDYGSEFSDTNNISLVTFLNCNGLVFMIPGDLEEDGWWGLLRDPRFVEELPKVNILVAPHHGRESGYCAEAMDLIRPNVVVFSDSEKKHATQEMTNTYGQYSSGVTFNGAPRKVLTTRSDGSITWRA